MNDKQKMRIFGILLAAFSLMSLVSLFGHTAADDTMITSNEAVYGNPFSLTYANWGGLMGAYFSYVTYFFLGWSALTGVLFLLVLSLKIVGLDLARRAFKHAAMIWAVFYSFLFLIDIGRVSGGIAEDNVPNGAGALGHTLTEILLTIIGVPGAVILTLGILASLLVYYFSISHRFRNLVAYVSSRGQTWLQNRLAKAGPTWQDLYQRLQSGRRTVTDSAKTVMAKTGLKTPEKKTEAKPDLPEEILPIIRGGDESPEEDNQPPEIKRRITLPKKSEASKPEAWPDDGEQPSSVEFNMPPLDLLAENPRKTRDYDKAELEETARLLKETLETFGVKLSGTIDMYPGPIITRYEIRPAAGIKVNQIANLSDDLALNLKAKSIRIVAPIPGKGAVGIEIPNRNPQMVYLRDILESDAYKKNCFELPLALGKNISGDPFVADLTQMPHLLIAGTTGSGKSVCINVVVTSLIYWHHPRRLKFIFIDPKMLELTVYRGIPYLEDSVVTNAKQAERVLGDVVAEMESRYRILANQAVRNIVDYNRKMKEGEKKLPYIVIVIDELADLMMSTHSARVEMLITRLAQMARAVGIHLILATQRPSVDVITGLIKANFPSRLAFQVATRTDSRTILDGNGAERLLGRGDMLFLETGSPEPERLHGAYISSEESEKIVEFIKSQPYSQKKYEEATVEAEGKAQYRPFTDPVLMEAVETVIQQGQASVSLLQRKLGIGYQRAARLIDELEEMKIIGPYNESKARDVLVDKTFVENIKSGQANRT